MYRLPSRDSYRQRALRVTCMLYVKRGVNIGDVRYRLAPLYRNSYWRMSSLFNAVFAISNGRKIDVET